MKLTATVKLQPNTDQSNALLDTLRSANEACNTISDAAWEDQAFRQFALHKLVYSSIRETTGLTAQVVVRCISKVSDAYKLDKRTKRTFKPTGAIAFDDRILRWKADDTVSIWTTAGRQVIPFVCGDDARDLLATRQGESDLFTRDGQWFLSFTSNVETPPVGDPDDMIGIDLGIVNIAADSDGTNYSGAHVLSLRKRNRKLRARLQSKGTKSAKRLLRQRRRKEARFAKDINHQISKSIVAVAEGTGRGIAVEDLTGIRDRVTARRPQRATLHSWSFHDLRAKIEYKAERVGVLVVAVDPRNSSRECPCCGHIDKANRKHRDSFLCVDCGFSGPSDYVAALNLRERGRAVVNQPYVAASVG